MGKRDRYRDHVDPELQRWGRTYRTFPGVEECVRLILTRKATGTWAEIVSFELAENARDHLADIIAAFNSNESDLVAIHLLIALELAALPESVQFLSNVLRHGNPSFIPYAQRALEAIDTQDSRRVLFEVKKMENKHAMKPAVGTDSSGESGLPDR